MGSPDHREGTHLASRMSDPRLDVWPPLPVGIYANRPATELPFPLDEPGSVIFELGRHALWRGLRLLGLGPGDEVLTPSLHHGSEVETLVRAGLVCRFYEAGAMLMPDEDELEGLIGSRTRALYLIHYLGFPQDCRRWRRWCDQHGLALLEDAAQSWLATLGGQPLGSFGDLAIFCLYNTFGLPDGGALICRAPTAPPDGSRPAGVGGLARRHAAWLMQRSSLVATLGSRLERQALFPAAQDYALGDPDSPPSAATLLLLRRVVNPRAAATRRNHYALLLDELSDLVPPPFADLPEGASPLAFPIATDDKDALRSRLSARGVRALDLWSVPHPSLPAAQFPSEEGLRSRVVALPVHQELRASDLERIVRAVRPPGRRDRRLELESLPALDMVRDEWSKLATASGNVFATWDWASIWWSHFGAGRRLELTACRGPDRRLVAILPLCSSLGRPLRMVRFLGHGPADALGPICAPADRIAAARALLRVLAQSQLHWDVFVGEQMPGHEGWSGLLGARVLSREGSPALGLEGRSWEEYLASRSANMRQQIVRRERKLVREHQLRYRLAGQPDRLDADLDTLFALHGARWSQRQSAFAGAHQSFHRQFAARALEQGWLRLWFLEVDGRARAAWYGFRFGPVMSYYQAGRDPAWDDSSVGFVLLAHSIRSAFEEGATEYRFLRGAEPFKYRFADDDPGLETIGLARQPVAALTLAAASTFGKRGPVADLRRRFVG